MRNYLLGVAAAALVLGGSTAIAEPQLDYGVYRPSNAPSLDSVQLFLFGGRHYCWYDAGWQGPGWYWCGYAWRGGYGWGGAYGWNGWHGGHPGGYSWGGGHHFRGHGGTHFSSHSSGGSHGGSHHH